MSKPPEPDDASTGERMRAALERRLADLDRAEQPSAPPLIPDHTLLRRIGSGAYGEVWLARNALGTLRAVKVVFRAHFKEDRPYERELHGILKYEPISRTHEGLVQVLHVGRNDAAGCFYYVMELADAAQREVISESVTSQSVESQRPLMTGSLNTDSPITDYSPRTLRSELARFERLAPVDAAQLVLRLAHALAHLHAHGLVHRDIKPGNVIFVHGHPKLADIGLVTDVGSSHSFVGTEGFIPPEGPGTPQADLYGLGKLLYELATGRDRMDFPQLPPLAASGGEPRAARRVADSPIRKEHRSQCERSHQDDSEALLELNEVMTRACAPEPKQRYASATELQAELNLFLAGRSLRHARNVERTLARLKRFAVAACVFLVLAAAALWFVKNEERHANVRAKQATERARAEAMLRQRAEIAEQATQQQLYTALLEQARATVLSGELGHRLRALDAVRRAAAISNSAALRGVAITALTLPDLRFERELPVASDVTLAKLDPAFERIAISRSNGPVEIRSVTDDQLLATLPASTNRPAFVGLWSPDGRFLAVSRDYDPAGWQKDVEVWEVAGAKRLLLIRSSPYGAMSFHPRLPRILVGRMPATASTWDLETGQELTRHRLAGEANVLSFAPDGDSFAASHAFGESWMIAIHQADEGTPRASHLFANRVTALDWHPGGRSIGVPDRGGAVHLMDAQTGRTRLLGQHKADAVSAEFSPDGKYLFTGGWDRELNCWEVKSMGRAFTVGLDSHHLQFRADGLRCAVWRSYPEVRVLLHAFEYPALHREFTEDLGGRRNFGAFSPDGRWLAASGGERLAVWDLHRDGPGATVAAEVETRVSFAANGELFVDRRGECSRWRLKPGTNAAAPPELERLRLARPEGFVSLCLVSNGVVFTGSRGSKLAGTHQLTGNDIPWARTVDGLNGASDDERWLGMFRSYSPHLYIHRLPGFERVVKLTNEARISRFEFSPLGDEVAVASRGGVEFWSTATWGRTRHLTGFTDIHYSPDAQTLWLSTQTRTAGLHDARTAEPLVPLPSNTLPLAVSPDQRYLAASVDSRRVQVWDLVELRQRLRELGLDWAER